MLTYVFIIECPVLFGNNRDCKVLVFVVPFLWYSAMACTVWYRPYNKGTNNNILQQLLVE